MYEPRAYNNLLENPAGGYIRERLLPGLEQMAIQPEAGLEQVAFQAQELMHRFPEIADAAKNYIMQHYHELQVAIADTSIHHTPAIGGLEVLGIGIVATLIIIGLDVGIYELARIRRH
ncbi:hypothetical protein JXB41_09185 [Candidatus Woesearchaeota archaeon]|nr:hypothetical protein [Candidatus Woesearchaeota archaeon]